MLILVQTLVVTDQAVALWEEAENYSFDGHRLELFHLLWKMVATKNTGHGCSVNPMKLHIFTECAMSYCIKILYTRKPLLCYLKVCGHSSHAGTLFAEYRIKSF
jgi:hypothetical protein